MATVKCRNSKNNVTYVYTVDYFYDEEQKKWRQKRHCIGKVDESTGKTVPTLPRGARRTKKDDSPVEQTVSSGQDSSLLSQIENLRRQILSLENDVDELRRENARIKKSRDQMIRSIQEAISVK